MTLTRGSKEVPLLTREGPIGGVYTSHFLPSSGEYIYKYTVLLIIIHVHTAYFHYIDYSHLFIDLRFLKVQIEFQSFSVEFYFSEALVYRSLLYLLLQSFSKHLIICLSTT